MDSKHDFQNDFTPAEGFIEGAVKDAQSITFEWNFPRRLIDGVRVKEIKNVPKENGYLTEVFRSAWMPEAEKVEQVFQVCITAGGISAWHSHQFTTDRLFVNHGLLKIVLFDARQQSPTYKLINEFRSGSVRPMLITVPPGVWHGVHNISRESAYILNIVDIAYSYEDPDHWRLPSNTDKIPYSFSR